MFTYKMFDIAQFWLNDNHLCMYVKLISDTMYLTQVSSTMYWLDFFNFLFPPKVMQVKHC